MSLLKSWLPSSDRNKTLPRYRDSSPSNHEFESQSQSLTVSTIQLPPTASRVLASSQRRRTGNHVTNALISLERKEVELQQYLQELLDAQPEALRAVTANDSQHHSDVDIDTASITRSVNGSKAFSVRQHAIRPISLRDARKGIWNTMRELSAIKEAQHELLDEELKEKQATLHRMNAWEIKRIQLDKDVNAIDKGADGSRAQELKDDERTLKDQINAMEIHLTELKSRHRAVRIELASLDNSVQARLSSYKSSLSMLESEIQRFLASPPQCLLDHSSEGSSYLSLPPGRRTLEMAAEHLKNEQQILQARREAAETEREALTDGAGIWQAIIEQITGFERRLREDLSRFSHQLSLTDDSGDLAADPTAAINSSLISHFDQIILNIENQYHLAEAKGWKLLICCIGAELEACRQGRAILVSSITQGHSSNMTPSQTNSMASTTVGSSDSGGSTSSRYSHFDALAALDATIDPDDPDPEMLVSR